MALTLALRTLYFHTWLANIVSISQLLPVIQALRGLWPGDS